jgi:hypothetical protein
LISKRGFSLAEIILAFGIVTVALLSLVAVFLSGLKLATHSRDLSAANEVGHHVLEAVKRNVQQSGFAYLPAGTFSFDGRPTSSTPAVGTPPATFPPSPYPGMLLNGTQFWVRVTGRELSSTLKEIVVDVYYGSNGHILLATRMHR